MLKMAIPQLLASACHRDDGIVLRPAQLRPAAAEKIANKLLESGFVREIVAKGDMPIWRTDENKKAFSLKIMKRGREAAETALQKPAQDDRSAITGLAGASDTGAVHETQQPTVVTNGTKPGSKRALILALLKRDEGVTIPSLMQATGWLPHTTRAALSGLRKNGTTIVRIRDPLNGTSIYRLEQSANAAAAI